jgi:hypothetical protein
VGVVEFELEKEEAGCSVGVFWNQHLRRAGDHSSSITSAFLYCQREMGWGGCRIGGERAGQTATECCGHKGAAAVRVGI